MRSLKDLHLDELEVAYDAAEALMEHKAYLPGSLLFMLVRKFRDDAREALGMDTGALPQRGQERRSLDELTSVELDKVSGAVGILLQLRFTAVMSDPALPRQLREFESSLNQQEIERERIRATLAS